MAEVRFRPGGLLWLKLPIMAEQAFVSFDLCGAGLTVAAPRRVWTDHFVRVLSRFETENAVVDAFHCVIREDASPTPPDGIPMTWEGDFLERRAGRLYETEAIEVVEVVGHGHVAIKHAEAAAEASMKPGSEAAFSFTPLMCVLDAALRSAGRVLIHAACLALPDRSGAIVVCAPSGFGKTTTSLALARGGFGLVSDDASIVEPRSEGPFVWGLPRRLKVHHQTVAMMPWIGEFPDTWNDEGEQAIDTATLRDLISISDPVPVPLKAVVVLGSRSDSGHRFALLSKAEALIRIAQDNVSNSSTGVKVWNRRQFDAYAELLRSTPVLQLNAGTEVDSLPAELMTALGQLVPD